MLSNVNRFRSSRRDLVKALGIFPLSRVFGAEDRMYLALNSVLVHGRVPWPQFPELAAKTGFPGCDIMLSSAMASGAAASRELFTRLKLKPGAIDFPVEFRKDEGTFQAGLAKLEDSARFAADINCPRMVTYILPSSDTPKAELRQLYVKRFTASAQVLAKHKVRLGLEFLGPLQFRRAKPNEFIWRMNEMLELAKDCGPNVGLLLDSWHWHHAGATTQDILAAGRDRIVHVHFNDAPDLPPDQIRDDQRLLPGEGVINLVGFLQALKQIGYRDALSVEVFGRMDKATPEEAARKGFEASQTVFRKAGIPV